MNVHERRIAASADRVGELLATWGSSEDGFWRTDASEPTWLDRGLEVGSRGGHGPVRYKVVGYEPFRRVELEFDPGIGLVGRHSFEIRAVEAESCVLRHELAASTHGILKLLRPLLIALHDAAVEDVLDHFERQLTGSAQRAQGTSSTIRWLGCSFRSRAVERCEECPRDGAAGLCRIQAYDCFSTVVLPGDPTEPRSWAERVFGRSPRWVVLLLRLRNLVARPLRLRTPGREHLATGFPVIVGDGDELVMGIDDRHLDFRVTMTVRDRHVHVMTSVGINNRLGRLYWALVRHIHPLVVRSALRSMPFPGARPS